MSARPQWYLASMGLTNRVQPYCRLATSAMHATPMMSCAQRYHGVCTMEPAAEADKVFGSPGELISRLLKPIVIFDGALAGFAASSCVCMLPRSHAQPPHSFWCIAHAHSRQRK